jgi:hypothetical protein
MPKSGDWRDDPGQFVRVIEIANNAQDKQDKHDKQDALEITTSKLPPLACLPQVLQDHCALWVGLVRYEASDDL